MIFHSDSPYRLMPRVYSFGYEKCSAESFYGFSIPIRGKKSKQWMIEKNPSGEKAEHFLVKKRYLQ